MANEKLQFKMGEWTEGFDSMAKVPGTVYVTTNEKAMYVDVDANTRIRLGDIIQVNSAQTAKPPFSTEALYYFIKENALMKWNGTAWKQLNSVSEITEDLEDLEERVDTAEGDIDAINATIGTVNDTATANTVYGAIAKAKASAVATAAADAKTKADNALAAAKTYADQAETDAVATAKTYTDDEIADVNATINNINNKIGTTGDAANKGTVYGAITAAKAHAETKATEAKDAAVAAAATDATNKANTALTDAKTYTNGKIANVNATIGTVESGKTVVGMIGEVETAVSNALKEAKSYADQAEADAVTAAKADATSKANKALADAKSHTNGKIATINATIGTAGDAATANTVYGAIAKAEADALADAKAYTDNMLQTADAMTFKGVLGGEGANVVTSLPEAAKVQAGDTYKIGAEGTYAGHVAKIGDLLIAVEDGKAEYVLVSSGYEDDYDARLGVDATNGKIILRDAMQHANGSVQFVGDGDNGSVKVQVTGTEDSTGKANSQVIISLQWGSF